MTKRRSIFGRLALGAAGLLVFSAVAGVKAQAQTPYWVADGPGSYRACGMYFKSNPVGPGRYQATNVPSAACNRLGYGNVYGWSRAGNSSVTLWNRFGRRMRTFNRMPGYPGYFRSGRLVFRPANTRWPGYAPPPRQRVCPRINRPVCGLRSGRYITFSNACVARRSGAIRLRAGRCTVARGCDPTFRGRYSGLRRKLYVPKDRRKYGMCRDYGWWAGYKWAGHTNLPRGYWTYKYPHWHIWARRHR